MRVALYTRMKKPPNGRGIMYHKKLEEDIRCPLEKGLQVFGGKWKSRILCVLNETGTLRYGELKKEMVNVTDAVLADSLKELTADGMILRKSYNVIPPRVEYSLSDRGKSVIPILQSICRWSGQFQKGKQTMSCGSVRNVTTVSPNKTFKRIPHRGTMKFMSFS